MRNILLASINLLGLTLAGAAELPAASEVLTRLEKSEAPPASGSSDGQPWEQSLKAFAEAKSKLSPEDAAKQWVDLGAAIKPPHDGAMHYGIGLTPRKMQWFLEIPAPDAWPFLEKGTIGLEDETFANSIKSLSFALNQKPDALWKHLQSKQSAEDESMHYGRSTAISAMLETYRNSAWIEPMVRQQIASAGQSGYLSLPPLALYLDETKTKALFGEVFALNLRNLSFEGGHTKTLKLAREVALEKIDKLTFAPWSLCNDVNDVALLQKLLKKFPQNGEDHYFGEAAKTLILHQVIAGDLPAALKTLDTHFPENKTRYSFDSRAVETVINSGQAVRGYQFAKELVVRRPGVVDARLLIHLASQAGASGEVVGILKAGAENAKLNEDARIAAQNEYIAALLADDQTDEALRLLRAGMDAKRKPARRKPDDFSFRQHDAFEVPTKLVELAQLLGKKELVTAALDKLEQEYAGALVAEDSRADELNTAPIALLHKNGRTDQAVELLLQSMTRHLKSQAEQAAAAGETALYQSDASDMQSALVLLAEIYGDAGRHDDVLELVEKAKYWGASDLIDVADDMGSERTLGETVAAALAAKGRADEALAIVQFLLRENTGEDRLYQRYLELTAGKTEAQLAFLDELTALDRFQERPLIWKARILCDTGKLDEAAAAAKAAIAIDPSDGEQGKGNRMRVYAVLADILEKKGDAAETAKLRNVVKAIRHSEDADDFYSAGLLKRAISMYKESLDSFSDAYCIQSRLARQLAELGLADEAAKHYEKAFELMPDSFGRVESHCFGCEKAFAGDKAQGIAETVFLRILEKNPKNPRAHYLLGYLRYEQERYDEALVSFRKAVELDPEYLNAWRKIHSLASLTKITAGERDAVTFKILELRPASETGSDTVADFKTLWSVAGRLLESRPKPVTALLALPASAEKLKAGPKEPDYGMSHYNQKPSEAAQQPPTPARALLGQNLIQSLLQ